MSAAPDLDTIEFEALVSEARALIPRFAPEWTDHNLHDPGMTLIDLLAWLVDQQVYRIGHVGARHLAAFAKLFDVAPAPAAPAAGVVFPPPGNIAAPVWLEADDARLHPVGEPELGFAIPRDLFLTAGRLERIEARLADGSTLVQPPAADGRLDLPARPVTLALDFDRPLVSAGSGPRPVSIGLELAEALPPATTRVPFEARYSVGGGEDVPVALDAAGPLDRRAIALGAMVPPSAAAEPSRLLIRLREDRVFAQPHVVRVAIDAIPVVQLETLPEFNDFPPGNGLPDQQYALEEALGLPDQARTRHPLRILTDAIEWQRVASLARSGPADRHFVFDEVRGRVRFGNGVNGAVPDPGKQLRRAALDVTRGGGGNAVAGLEWNARGVTTRTGTFGRNPVAVDGGRDAETPAMLADALQAAARLRSAMLGNAELREAAQAEAGALIDRLEVLPRYSPALPGRALCGTRTLLVHPRGPGRPTEFTGRLRARLEPRRLLGERLHVVASSEALIDCAARLHVAAGSDAGAALAAAEARLRARFSAFSSGLAQAPRPAGRRVTTGEIEGVLAGTQGVLAVSDTRFARAGEPLGTEDVLLGRTELAVAGAVSLAVTIEEPDK